MTEQQRQLDHGDHISIGLRDLYDQIQVVASGYTSLSAKLDTALISKTMAQQTIAQQLADVRRDLSDHEMRLRAQEQRQFVTPKAMWTATGVLIAGIGLVFGVVQTIIQAVIP